uniref:F-box domain-containing protein n=1 Tax=Romanomermis culicivorax TaxID=13658 RepID=A0A915JYK8_ROMCU
MGFFTDEVLSLVLPYFKFEELCAIECVSKNFQRLVISTCRLKKHLNLKFLQYLKLIDSNCFRKIEAYCKNLRGVELPTIDSEESFRIILECLKQLENLTSIAFIGDLTLPIVADFLCQRPNLEFLTLTYAQPADEDVSSSIIKIRSAISNMKYLKHLSIDSRFYPENFCSNSTLTHFKYNEDGIHTKIDWIKFFDRHPKLDSFGLKHHLWKEDTMLRCLSAKASDIKALELRFFDAYTEDINHRRTLPIIDWLINDLRKFVHLRKLILNLDTYSSSLELNTDLIFKNIVGSIPRLEVFEFGATDNHFQIVDSLDINHVQFLESITLSFYEITNRDLITLSRLPKLKTLCIDVCCINEDHANLASNRDSSITELKINRRLFEKQTPKIGSILQHIGWNLELLDLPVVHDKLLSPIFDFCPNLTSLIFHNVEMRRYCFSKTEKFNILEFLAIKMPSLLHVTLQFGQQTCSDKLLSKVRHYLTSAENLKSFLSTNLQLIRKLRKSPEIRRLKNDRRFDVDIAD